jgi:hypothetical protein
LVSKVCKKCGEKWSTPTKDCYRRDHEVQPLQEFRDRNKKGSTINNSIRR